MQSESTTEFFFHLSNGVHSYLSTTNNNQLTLSLWSKATALPSKPGKSCLSRLETPPSHHPEILRIRQYADSRIFHLFDTVPAEEIIPDRILPAVNALFKSVLQFEKLFFLEIRAFEDGLLDPLTVFLEDFDGPVSRPVFHDVETDKAEQFISPTEKVRRSLQDLPGND